MYYLFKFKKLLYIVCLSFISCEVIDDTNEYLLIQNCMQEWVKRTNGAILLETAPYGKEDVKIIKMGSNIFQGATIKGKYIIISNVTERIVYHEIGHVIGLMHEHQRPDSFLYITINYRKLIKRNLLAIYSFLPLKPSDFKYNYKNYIYDYYSIMHYNETESGNIIDGHGHALSGDEPSEIDIQKVRDMYAAKPLRITFALYGFN